MFKPVLLFFLFFTLTFSLAAQQRATVYYTQLWEITERDKAHYVRNCLMRVQDTLAFAGPVRDHYLSGKLQMEGEYNTSGQKHGQFITYNPDGLIVEKGSFTHDKKSGRWEYWYPEGKQKRLEELHEDGMTKTLNYWEKDGTQTVVDGNGTTAVVLEDRFLIKGNYISGLKEGKWSCFHKGTGNFKELFFVENFEKGVFLDGYISSASLGKSPLKAEYFLGNEELGKFPVTEAFTPDFSSFEKPKNEPVSLQMLRYVLYKEPIVYRIEPQRYEENSGKIAEVVGKKVGISPEELQIKFKITLHEDGTLTDPVFLKPVSAATEKKIRLIVSHIQGAKPLEKEGAKVQSTLTVQIIRYTVQRRVSL